MVGSVRVSWFNFFIKSALSRGYVWEIDIEFIDAMYEEQDGLCSLSGKPSTQGPKATGERYLPKKARESLSASEYAATSRKKRKDTKAGKQHSPQPKKIAKKTAKYRS